MSRTITCLLIAAITFCLAGASAEAQSVISARSGVIHFVEGDVFLDDAAVDERIGKFPEIKPDSVFRTEAGRAEILLTPGSFLRVGENSAIKMIANRLSETRIEVLRGSVLLECAELDSSHGIFLRFNGQEIHAKKNGLYRVDTEPPQLRVYEGEAIVSLNGNTATVKGGRQLELDGLLLPATKFNNKEGDALYRWAKRRSGYISLANLSAARKASDSGLTGWIFSPYFGMYTFVPMRGITMSPFGWRYYSPRTIGRVYERPVIAVNPGRSPSAFGGGFPARHPNLGYSGADRGASASVSPGAVSTSAPPPSVSSAPDAGRSAEAGSRGESGRSGGRGR
jgi:hypothetical protein